MKTKTCHVIALIFAGIFIGAIGNAVHAQSIGRSAPSDCADGFSLNEFALVDCEGCIVTSWTITGAQWEPVFQEGNYKSLHWLTGGTARVSALFTYANGSPGYKELFVTVFPAISSSVTITPASVTSSCNGSITFTANPTNGGTNPYYYWYVNGQYKGSSSPHTNTFTYSSWTNQDAVTVNITPPYAECIQPFTSSPAIVNVPAMTSPGQIDNTTRQLCYKQGSIPTPITPSTPVGGFNHQYLWQQSVDGNNWTSTGVTTLSYNPGLFSEPKFIRRSVTSCGTTLYTNAVHYVDFADQYLQLRPQSCALAFVTELSWEGMPAGDYTFNFYHTNDIVNEPNPFDQAIENPQNSSMQIVKGNVENNTDYYVSVSIPGACETKRELIHVAVDIEDCANAPDNCSIGTKVWTCNNQQLKISVSAIGAELFKNGVLQSRDIDGNYTFAMSDKNAQFEARSVNLLCSRSQFVDASNPLLNLNLAAINLSFLSPTFCHTSPPSTLELWVTSSENRMAWENFNFYWYAKTEGDLLYSHSVDNGSAILPYRSGGYEVVNVAQSEYSCIVKTSIMPAVIAVNAPCSLNENYIISNTIQVANIKTKDAVSNLPIESRSQVTQFADGLGRPMQTVSRQASPGKNDIVQPILYDAFGREARKYLPFVATETSGWYKDNNLLIDENSGDYVGIAASFYNNATARIANDDNKPYAETIFEASPLNRVIKQGAPGLTWQPDATASYTSQDHTIKMKYEANTVTDKVLLWTYTALSGVVTAGTSSLPEYYMPNQLYKTSTKDELHHEVIEFKDKEGHVVLKRVQAPDNLWADTYYIYDDYGRLITVLPPEAVKTLTK